MPALSLQQLAYRTAIRNVKDIDSIEGMNYALAKPFLVKVDNPDQLGLLEKSEPSIYGETSELWRGFITRDAPGFYAQGGKDPKRPENWYKIYQRAVKEDQERINQGSAALKARMDQQNAAKHQQQTTLLTSIRAPTSKRRHGTSSSRQPPAAPGSRTKIVGGRSLLERARREAREANVMSRRNFEPTNTLLPSRSNPISTLPTTSSASSRSNTSSRSSTSISGQRPTPPRIPYQTRPPGAPAPRPGLKKTSASSASHAVDHTARAGAAPAGQGLPRDAGPPSHPSAASLRQRSPDESQDGAEVSNPPKATSQPGAVKASAKRRSVNIFATPPRKSRPV